MKYISIRNYEKYQHYKDRRPPWIKLYNDILEDYDFIVLPDDSKFHLIGMMLLASRNNNQIPHNLDFISSQLGAKSSVNLKQLKKFLLFSKGRNASIATADDKQNDALETETYSKEAYKEETEKESTLSGKPDDVSLVLEYLNKKTGRRYTLTTTNRSLIAARLKDCSIEDIQGVIDRKYSEWTGTDNDRYLRPQTLFNATKFDNYMNEDSIGGSDTADDYFAVQEKARAEE